MPQNRSLRLTALLIAAGALLAAAPAFAETKIAVVDMQRAIIGTDEGKAASTRLKGDAEAKQKVFNDRKAELEKAGQDYDKQKSLMSEDAKKQKEAELQKKFRDLQDFGMATQKELSDREQEATRSIYEKMAGLLREIAENEGISIVLQANAAPYFAESLDVTNELVRKYNARYKTAGSASAAPAAKDGAKKGAKGSGK